jgi:hypothetical protein
VDKIKNENISQGSLLLRKCQRCGKETRYYVQYKAIIDKNWVELTLNPKNAIIGLN